MFVPVARVLVVLIAGVRQDKNQVRQEKCTQSALKMHEK